MCILPLRQNNDYIEYGHLTDGVSVYIKQRQRENLKNSLIPGKVVVIYGARRTGKTIKKRRDRSRLFPSATLFEGSIYSTFLIVSDDAPFSFMPGRSTVCSISSSLRAESR